MTPSDTSAQARHQLRPAAGAQSHLRVVARLQKRAGSWVLLSGDVEIQVRPRWRTRGGLLDRQLLWYLRSSEGVYDAIPARDQPNRLLKAQPDGRFPSGLRAATAKSRPAVPSARKLARTNSGARRNALPQLQASRIDFGRVPARACVCPWLTAATAAWGVTRTDVVVCGGRER